MPTTRHQTEDEPVSGDEIPLATLPERVLSHARPMVGELLRAVALGGMSGARVVRVSGPDGTLVAKAGVSARERAVYERLANQLTERGIRIPQWYATVINDDVWLLIEDIPHPLPRERWLADSGVMAVLRRLHHLPPSTLDILPDHFRPEWTAAMDQAAVAWLGDDARLTETLAVLRREAAPLFEPRAVISGDPNPLNWGLSVDRELVLMDWERLGLGHAALDVAITIPGLPTLPDFERTAHTYSRRPNPPDTPASEPNSRQLVLAKVWTVVELLATTPRRPDGATAGPDERRRKTAAHVAELVPSWLREVV